MLEVVTRGDAALEQGRQQAAQQHGVGDVGNVELVEAQDLELHGQAFRHQGQRVGSGRQLLQLPMQVLHEEMEMDPQLAWKRQRFVELIHQVGLAAPYPPPPPTDRGRVPDPGGSAW